MCADQVAVRTEFGYGRTSCGCNACQVNCKYMPGFLIPADLDRMLPADTDPFLWALDNLLASPGALVSVDGQMFRIPTLVPAKKPDGSCIHLTAEGRCGVHAVSPFGCAFFDCGPERGRLSRKGISAVLQAWIDRGPYATLWVFLESRGRVSEGAEVLRERMREALVIEQLEERGWKGYG